MSLLILSLFLRPQGAHAWFERFKVPVATAAPRFEVLPTPGFGPQIFRMIDDQTGNTCYIVAQTTSNNSTTIACVKSETPAPAPVSNVE